MTHASVKCQMFYILRCMLYVLFLVLEINLSTSNLFCFVWVKCRISPLLKVYFTMYLQLDMGTEWYFVEIGHLYQYTTSLPLLQQLSQFWICQIIWPYNPIQQTETLKLVNKLKGISEFVEPLLWGTISVAKLELMFVQKYWFWVLQDVSWTTWSYRQFIR